MKCIVNNCNNYTDQGEFVGSLCAPCYRALTTGDTTNTAVYWLVPIRTSVPEYGFSAEIIAALKEGKPVWSKSDVGDWILITKPEFYSLPASYTNKWSLTKPKAKVKKYNWIYQSRYGDYHMTAAKYATKEEAVKDFTTIAMESEVLEPYMPSVVEVEL